MNRFTKEQLTRILLIAGIVLVVMAGFVLFFEKGLYWLGVTVRYVGMLITPFLLAWLVAVLTSPMTGWLTTKLHVPRSLAVLIMLMLLIALVAGMCWLVVAVLSDVMADLAYYSGNIERYASDFIAMVKDLYGRLEFDTSSLQTYFTRATDKIESWASQGADAVFSVVKATPGFIVLLFFALIATFYWCREEKLVRDMLINLFPMRFRNKAGRTYDDFSHVVGGYVRAQMLLLSVSTIICIVGFTVVGAESPLAMGLFAGVMDILPILGPGTLIIPWAVWSIIMGRLGMGVGLLVVFGVVTITRYILEPKIVGDRVGLHPLGTLAAIFIGMKMFGIVGLILGPIVAALIAATLRLRRQNRAEEAQTITNGAPESDLP